MAVAAYEQYGISSRMSYLVPEQREDIAVRSRAAGFIGAVATGAWNNAVDETRAEEALALKPLESLYDAIQAAAKGDPAARKMIEINASTDVIERTIKSGHVMQVDLMVDAAGTIQQHGQSLESVQANSLRFASNNRQMRQRTEAETRNAFRIKHFYQQGSLEDYYFVVMSRAADDMTTKEMTDAGFFTDTMSCAIQATCSVGDRLVMESAFVAGTRRPGEVRHDQTTIVRLAARLGLDCTGLNATQLLDSPWLIHKSLMPDGVSNLVELYDDCAADDNGGPTFYGEAKLRQNYQTYRQKCADREANFRPKVGQIVRDLIAEAPTITTRLMATERLSKLSGKHMIELAVKDVSINSEVFGPDAAARLEMARWHYQQDNLDLMASEVEAAVEVDQSSSCPSGRTKSPNDANSSKSDSSKEESGDCEFVSKECPECHKKNVKTVVKKIGNTKHISGNCGCSITVKAE